MTLVELFAPKGALSEQRRRRLGERLVTELVAAPGAPVDLIERGRAITWLVVHEPQEWTVGGRPVDVAEPPRYLVRVSVPGGHLSDGMRAEMVTRLTRVLAEGEEDSARLYDQPDAWVHIIEVPDGNIAAFGQILPTADITSFVVRGSRPHPNAPIDDAVATAIDPICGMTVSLSDGAITVEQDGTTYAFCNLSCRDIFLGGTGPGVS